jgi:hypothetical protein
MALKSRLAAFRAGLPAALDRGVFNAAVAVEDLATQLAPEDTGALKASGHVSPEAPNGGLVYQVVFGDGAVDYAQFVEYGTDNPNYPIQPYLHPAAAQIDIKTEVRAAIRDLARTSTV